MLTGIHYSLIASLMTNIILFTAIYNEVYRRHQSLMMITTYSTTNQTNRTSPIKSTYIHPMFNDPEAHTCYSLKSLAMPEQIMNLNAIVVTRQELKTTDIPTEVTFNNVHSILYGDPSTKLIYKYGQKYFNKTFDRSYPSTQLTQDIFTSIIAKLHPTLNLQFVVEIGSFTGNSASNMGNVLKKKYPGSFLLCIDTWLGDLNMWVNKAVWEHLSVTEDGRPTVYYQFLMNIIQQNLTDTVLPASMSSIIGARFLQTFQFRPQLIYLDSAHEQGETLIELALYWNLLKPGGVLFGDDWNWISVRCDVKKFMYIRNLTVELTHVIWIIKKPLNETKL